MAPLQEFTADHRYLIAAAAQAGGFRDPVAFDADEYETGMLKASRAAASRRSTASSSATGTRTSAESGPA